MTESSQHVKVVCGACLVTSVLAMPLAGQAQVPLPGDVNQAIQEGARILREQEQYERQRRGSEALKRQRPGGEAPMLIPPSGDEDQRDSRCVDVGSLMLTGATRLSEAELADVRQAVVGKCVTSTMINGVLAKLTNLYAARGYITTRAYVPPQDVAEGVLRIVVLEGLVARIDVRPPGSASAATAFPGLTGAILNLRDFEQGIDQINRLSSNSARIDIRPGSSPGDSIVVVNNEARKRWSGYASLDNSGSEATGRYQGSVSLGLDDLVGINDGLSLSHRQSIGEDRGSKMSRSDGFSVSVPYGYWLGTLSYTDFSYRTLVRGQVTSFVSKGDSQTALFRLDRVAYRDQSDKLTVSATLARKENHNYIADLLIATSSRVLSVLDLDVNLSRVSDGRLISLDAGVSRGVPVLGGMSDPAHSADSAPRAEFTKFKFGLGVFGSDRLGGRDFNWSSSLNAQHAAEVLFPGEQILVTGPYAVRGFTRASLAGDSGYYWRNEIGLPMTGRLGAMPVSFRPHVGLDFGSVINKHSVPGGRAWGMTLGCSATLGAASLQTFFSRGYLKSDDKTSSKDHLFSVRLVLPF